MIIALGGQVLLVLVREVATDVPDFVKREDSKGARTLIDEVNIGYSS